MERFDAVVAGGGIAGSLAAAALAARGLRVLVCEAHGASEKRLAGELMHAPAVRVLAELGLLAPLQRAGAVAVEGFVVVERGALRARLSYDQVPGGGAHGLALDHALLCRTLLDAVRVRAGVTVWQPARVVEATPGPEGTAIRIACAEGTVEVRAGLLVSAEGRSSHIRDRAGLQATRGAPFRMLGVRVPNARLPHGDFGHLFLGGPSAGLAYPVSGGAVRVMFEADPGSPELEACLLALPSAFQAEVRRALETEPVLGAKVFALSPSRVTGRRLAVVGDAGGCVHPLTATGIAFCAHDAMRLAQAVGEHPLAEIERSLDSYERGRREPMRTRAALGPALAEVLSSQAPGMRLMRHGLFVYWESPAHRAASMALLSTQEGRARVLAAEWGRVGLEALRGAATGALPWGEVLPGVGLVARRTLEHARRLMGAE